MKLVTIRKDAELDIEEAYQWYEGNQAGLGEEFLDNLAKTINLIQESPELHPIVHPKSIRRAFTNKFPYGVFYLEQGASIIVVAVMHTRRNPGNWRQRI